LGAYVLLLVMSIAVSWTAVLIGVMVDNPEKVQIFGFVVVFPLTFCSNAFVPAQTMPGWLQAWIKVNPVTILADAVRSLVDGAPSWSNIGLSLLWALGITLVFAPLAVARFRRRI
jgi:ABC-2 type transport system permease protein/oleandomycin transport system permease protein